MDSKSIVSRFAKAGMPSSPRVIVTTAGRVSTLKVHGCHRRRRHCSPTQRYKFVPKITYIETGDQSTETADRRMRHGEHRSHGSAFAGPVFSLSAVKWNFCLSPSSISSLTLLFYTRTFVIYLNKNIRSDIYESNVFNQSDRKKIS